MKRIFFFSVSSLLLNSAGIAQNVNLFPSTDNAGIGTITPTTKLHLYFNNSDVNNLSNNNFITIENRGSSNANYTASHVIGGLLFAGYQNNKTPANVAGIWVTRYPFSSGGSTGNSSSGDIVFGAARGPGTVSNITTDNKLPPELMRISSGGGILLNSNLQNDDIVRPGIIDDVTSEIRGGSKNAYWKDDGFLRLSAGGGTNANTKSYIDLSGHTVPQTSERYNNIVMGTAGVERIRIDALGNVSIGTSDPKGYKFAVNGSAIFTKAVVKLNANWPDYVFEPTYKLLSLEALESFITLNKHLPEMPAAAEVSDSGIDLGGNQVSMLKKIEELTLYIIDQNNKQQTQQTIIEQQSKLLQEQQTLLNKILQEIDAMKKNKQ